MNLDSIPHPGFFFIEDLNSLRDPENNFVENLQNFLNVVQDLEVSFKYTELLQGELFTLIPWSHQYEKFLLKQDLVGLFGQLSHVFQKHGNPVQASNLEPSDSNPELDFFNPELLKETKKLITYFKNEKKMFFISNGNSNYSFSYKGRKLNIKSVRPNKLYEEIRSYKNWLPRNKSDFDKQMRECIKIYMKKRKIKIIDTYSYTFDKDFKKDFLNAPNNDKEKIIEKTGDRMSKNEKEAREDLMDEYISTTKMRRFRVSDKFRIMYSYINKDKNNFLFKSFDTDHDKSLKKRN
ncbi:MAG: hypothetical protein VX794_00015 [Nitrospinota bacterium]|nr:hypothetical protein [Nitrospinota bacterium]